ncbi:MinD/ParA family protein [Moorella naiadis]|uniref:MinD/ParA family protein n=1 Tax=Moorella naiadis (nom. illeg.) TaxID=3093670 RepID=UPI003D9C98AD
MDQAARLRKLVIRRQEERARVITIASGKGGVGKTNITVNLGLILARQGRRTLLFDADLGLANLDILLGLLPHHTITEVIAGQRDLAEVVVQGPQGLLLVPGATGIQELADLDAAARDRLIADLDALAQEVDVLLVDSGAGISRTVLAFAAAAGETIVVATPEPTSITDAYGLLKALHRLGVKPRLLVNRAATPGEGQQAAGRLQETCRRFLQLELPLLGIIPEDRHVGEAVRSQQPFSELYPRCPATRALEAAAAGMTGAGEPPASMGGFWQRLGRLLGR